ncbi:MAG: hypothetical protein AAFU57_14955 [Bacteroidota bacterium]
MNFLLLKKTLKTPSSCRSNAWYMQTAMAYELTHAGHTELDPGIFSIAARSCRRDMLMESWAEGVETIVTNDRYFGITNSYRSTEPRDVSESSARWNGWRQERRATQFNEYTPIVEDLVDNNNQNDIDDNFPVDEVNGYTLNRIQTALKGSRSPNTWRIKLNTTRPNGVTTSELNTLFTYMNQALINPQTCD